MLLSKRWKEEMTAGCEVHGSAVLEWSVLESTLINNTGNGTEERLTRTVPAAIVQVWRTLTGNWPADCTLVPQGG
jgi:hypothetical protein